ncbi:MAG: type secretion outer membrane protein TolC family [Rhodospirillales bacterium]|jgi:TolC family type I secretion outer membrane protein|nr:type secretion outer membrane protein TolC family [Rhodospirillales bacterium]
MTLDRKLQPARRRRGALRRTVSRLPVALAVLWSLGAAVPAWAQSLTDVLATTYSTNPELMAGRAELRATNELVPQALSGWRPTIAGTASIGRTWIDSEVGSDATNPRTVGLSLSQPVYRGGRTVAATREAENLVLAQRARLVGVEQDVLLDAVAAYMDVVRDAAVLELNVNNQQVLSRQLEAARDRFEVGEITRTDVAQSEARLAGANASRIAAEGDLTESRARFVEVVGEAPGTLETPPILATLPGSLEEAIEVAVNANPNVVAADYVERAARDGVDVVFGELLPSIALQGEVEYGEEQSTFADDRTTATVEAQVTVPLYQAGEVSSRVREAKKRASQRRLEMAQQRRGAAQIATTAWEALSTARAQIDAFEAQVRSAEIALEGVREEAQVGSRTILDVLDAEQELLDARVSLVRAKRDEIVAGFQLLAAVGNLTARDLDLPVEYYDYQADYLEVRNKLWGVSVNEE